MSDINPSVASAAQTPPAFASDASSYVTGIDIRVDGGYSVF